MGVYIKNWSLADWKELLKWAKIGANNAMIGEFTEVEEVPPHIEEKKMKYDSFDELCPYCGRILRGYEGLKECFCKFCGGKILR